jgi:hypothetical protein
MLTRVGLSTAVTSFGGHTTSVPANRCFETRRLRTRPPEQFGPAAFPASVAITKALWRATARAHSNNQSGPEVTPLVPETRPLMAAGTEPSMICGLQAKLSTG